MNRWEITFPVIGNFEFEGNFEIAEVTFSKNAARKEWEAKTIIEAESRDNAITKAKEKVENILDVIAFVRETGLEMGYPRVYQLDYKEDFQVARVSDISIINKTHQRIIKRVYENLKPCFRNPPEEIEKAILAIRWYRRGCFFDNPSDRFLAFWIALECLVGGKEEVELEQITGIIKKCKYFIRKTVRDNNLRSKIIDRIEGINKLSITETMIKNIKNILPNVNAGLEKKIRDMQKDRSNMVHKGVSHIDKIEKHNNYLKERLLERLLKEKLDMAFNNFINSWPTPKLRESLRDDYLEIEPIKQVLLKYPEGATIDEVEYGLYAVTPKNRRHLRKLEKLIEMGEIRNQIVNNKERFFLNT